MEEEVKEMEGLKKGANITIARTRIIKSVTLVCSGYGAAMVLGGDPDSSFLSR